MCEYVVLFSSEMDCGIQWCNSGLLYFLYDFSSTFEAGVCCCCSVLLIILLSFALVVNLFFVVFFASLKIAGLLSFLLRSFGIMDGHYCDGRQWLASL